MILVKTSKLICKIFRNEEEMDLGKLNNYITQLLKMGFLELSNDGLSLKLTQKGIDYADKE